MEKLQLRKEALRKRSELTNQDRLKAGCLIAERIIGHQWFYLSDIVLGFVSYGTEIDTKDILEEALKKGKKLFVPKVCGEEICFFRIFSLDDLKSGYKGILEPVGDTEKYFFQAEEAKKTVMLMPGVAFDRFNHRIGYGKGFYDRFLAGKEELRCKTIALGYQCQLVEDFEPDEHDLKPYQVILV